jgi:hypothetical protein
MKVYNRTEHVRSVVEEFERAVKQLGGDEGSVQVNYGEYRLLLDYYGVKKSWPWQAWPKIKGVTVIPQPLLK